MDRGLPRVYRAADSRWFKIDLRAWGGSRMVLRDPNDPRWPDRGARTDSQEEAEEWAVSYHRWIKGELRRKRLGLREELTLTEATKEHLAHRSGVVERATWSADRTALNHLLNGFRAGYPLSGIQTSDLQWLVDGMLAQGYETSTLGTYRKSWSVFFDRMLGHDPAADVNVGVKASKPLGEIRTLSDDQVTELFKAARKVDEQRIGEFPSGVLACGLGLYMGLRQGEIFAQQWPEIDQATKTARVRFQVPKDRLELVPTKGKYARTVLVRRGWWSLHHTDRIGFVCGRQGRPVGTRTQRNLITRILDTAQLNGPRLGWHILRHTYALRLLEEGASMEELQLSLGHSSIVTTQKSYDHRKSEAVALRASARLYQE